MILGTGRLATCGSVSFGHRRMKKKSPIGKSIIDPIDAILKALLTLILPLLPPPGSVTWICVCLRVLELACAQ